MATRSFHQLIMRIWRRPDGNYQTRSVAAGGQPMEIHETLYAAVQTATRDAQRSSRKGKQVIILLQETSRRWKQVDVINPGMRC